MSSGAIRLNPDATTTAGPSETDPTNVSALKWYAWEILYPDVTRHGEAREIVLRTTQGWFRSLR
jgi:hypothetical protein